MAGRAAMAAPAQRPEQKGQGTGRERLGVLLPMPSVAKCGRPAPTGSLDGRKNTCRDRERAGAHTFWASQLSHQTKGGGFWKRRGGGRK